MNDTVIVPLGQDFASTIHKVGDVLRHAIREYSFQNGCFIDEVAANLNGVRRVKGNPSLIYTLKRVGRA